MSVLIYEDKAHTLAWANGTLTDPTRDLRYLANGTIDPGSMFTPYPFDRAVSDGEHSVVYTLRATKGLVFGPDGALIREIDRSYYCADVYEYPVALRGGVLAHCPNEYNELELEEVATGRRLWTRAGDAPDHFHSRLAFAPDGRHLLSAGWRWHPVDLCPVYAVEELDAPVAEIWEEDGEIGGAAWIDDDRILVALSGEVGVWSLAADGWVAQTPLKRPAGTVMPVGDEHFVAFYEHPRLIETRTGRIVEAWDAIDSGLQTGTLIHLLDPPPPPIALDPAGRRFAVASPTHVSVVTV